MRRRGWVVLIVLAVLFAVGLGIALSLYQLSQTTPLMQQANDLSAGDPRVARQQQILQFQADNLAKIWTTLVQAVVGIVLAIGAYFTWRNVRVAQQGQITNRFTQAIDQLGAVKEGKDGKKDEANLEVRLGGIYALDRVARDSPQDQWTIVEVLTAYVRENARWVEPTDVDVSPPEKLLEPSPQAMGKSQRKPRLRADIQAVLTVIGRRLRSGDRPEPALDLRDTNLRWADLQDAHLEGAFLGGAHLERAFLENAHLERASLEGTHLDGAELHGAHLEHAYLEGAHLEHAFVGGAHLDGANLTNAHLDGANLTNAYLTEAFLIDTHLDGADLRYVYLMGANLTGAHLEGANLTIAHMEGANLTRAHLEGADLSYAFLNGAVLQDTHLDGADLERAHLDRADLTGAHLEKAINLTRAQLDG